MQGREQQQIQANLHAYFLAMVKTNSPDLDPDIEDNEVEENFFVVVSSFVFAGGGGGGNIASHLDQYLLPAPLWLT